MKKMKVTNPFWFSNKSHQEVVDIFNDQYPIDLRYNEDLVNRVHKRYPILDKSSIALSIRSIFETIRDLLFLGKILNFHNLFFDTKMFFFAHVKSGNILPSLKVKIKMPPKLRKI